MTVMGLHCTKFLKNIMRKLIQIVTFCLLTPNEALYGPKHDTQEAEKKVERLIMLLSKQSKRSAEVRSATLTS